MHATSLRPARFLARQFAASVPAISIGALFLAVRSSPAQNFRDFHNHNTGMKQLQPTWPAPLVTSTT